jgi:hypothetical protein
LLSPELMPAFDQVRGVAREQHNNIGLSRHSETLHGSSSR